MVARSICTILLLLLAFYAFLGNALSAGRYFNPFGILFLFLAYLVWSKWEIVRDAFSSVKDESNIPILRMGYKIIEGLGAKKPRDDLPAERSSSSR